jgi:large subunit ribosomal protein L28
MSKKCQVTGSKPSYGYKYAIRGIAKKKKGIGLKVTGRTKRRFEPNLIKKRVWFALLAAEQAAAVSSAALAEAIASTAAEPIPPQAPGGSGQ